MKYASITDRLAGLGSGKWEVHYRARAMQAEGRKVIELTIGEPDIPPDAALLDVCNNAMRTGRTRYSSGQGEPALLNAIAAKYSRRTGRAISTDQVLCFSGTQTALFAVMAGLVETGDAVLIPDPYYATYEGVVRATGAAVVPVPTWDRHRFHLQAADLEAAITPEAKVLLLNTPHNPTGAVLTADEVAAIGDVCRRHDLWIVCDEVYEDLILEGTFASPFDRADLAERTIVTSSISKSHAAPGFRSGWAVGPVEFCERLLPVSEIMLFGGQPFIADMTAYALTHDIPTAATMRDAYRRRAGIVCVALAGHPALKPLSPEAGMFLLIDVRGSGMTGDAFARGLLEAEEVAVMPGSSFGAQAEGFIRLSLTVAGRKAGRSLHPDRALRRHPNPQGGCGMTRKTVGEVLVDLLEARGVDTVFGIPGVHTVELYRGLAASKIRHVTPRHEGSAGFMADGYAPRLRQAGRVFPHHRAGADQRDNSDGTGTGGFRADAGDLGREPPRDAGA